MADEIDPKAVTAWIDKELRKEAEAREAAKQADIQAAAKAEADAAASNVANLSKFRSSGTFKPGHDVRRATNPGSKARPKRSLAESIRIATEDLTPQVKFMTELSEGNVDGATIRDRVEAVKWLADRAVGKAVETVVNVDSEEKQDPLDDLTTDELRALAKAGN